MGRRRRRRRQLLDDRKEKTGYRKLKEEAPDRTVWRMQFVWKGPWTHRQTGDRRR